ncbi:MAG TPA: hypothetical protein VGQ70_03070 [Candidatus Udaeobacter sp.]|nr:hypothetical protein [Candidatus Udaeobacter sp.]
MSTSAGTPLNGGTNNVAVTSSNTYSAFAISEFDNFGLQLTVKASSASNAVFQIYGFKSLDSTSYETTPSLNQDITLTGTTALTTVINVSVPSAATYKVQILNTNTSVAVTNITLLRRVKSPKRAR